MTIGEKQKSNDAIVGCSYVFSDEVATETPVGAMSVWIELKAEKDWKSIYFTPGTAVLNSKMSNPFQGKIVESEFEIKLPGLSSSLMEDLSKICGRSVVVKLDYESGSSLVCGGKSRKLRLYSSGVSGTKNGYAIGFAYKSKTDFLWLAV